MDSGQSFGHNEPDQEDVIWEIDVMTEHLHAKVSRMESAIKTMSDEINDNSALDVVITSADEMQLILSNELFDKFTYCDNVTVEEIPWKEYFHVLYDAIVPENEYVTLFTVLSMFKCHVMICPPDGTPPTQRTRNILNIFKAYILEYDKYMSNINIDEIMSNHRKAKTDIGTRLVHTRNELRTIKTKLDVYTRILAWSLK
jgi:hypothetical protein